MHVVGQHLLSSWGCLALLYMLGPQTENDYIHLFDRQELSLVTHLKSRERRRGEVGTTTLSVEKTWDDLQLVHVIVELYVQTNVFLIAILFKK